MAALDFPASPTDGQVYANWVYSSAKGAWKAKPLTGQKIAVSATAPLAPTLGDEWYNSNDGSAYVYYTDVDGSQWVQIKSDATLSSTLGNRVTTLETYPSGLVPIVPTSVTMGSGSATINANGKVSFTTSSSATGVSLNGVFTSAYENYKVVFNGAGSSLGAGLYMRLRNAGSDFSSGSYFYSGWYSRSTASANGYWSGHGTTQFDVGRIHTDTTGRKCSSVIDVLGPSTTGRQPMITCLWAGEDSGSPLGAFTNGALAATGTYDGLTFVPSTGTFVGTVQVYGLR